MNKEEKSAEVAAIKDLLGGAQLVVLAEYAGTNVENMVKLRADLRKQSAGFRVMKNTLAKLATTETELEKLHPHFVGPVGVAYSTDDPAAAAKVLVDFAKNQKHFELRAGFLKGGKVLGADDVDALSKLPSKDELRAKLLSAFTGVPRSFVSVLAATPRNFVGVLESRRRQLAGEA